MEIDRSHQIYPTEVVLVRHGQSELNVRQAIAEANHEIEEMHLGRDIRDADVPLTDLGRQQAKATGQAIAKHYGEFDIAYISPHKRTLDTFNIIRDQLDQELDARLEDRIREKEFGVVGTYTLTGMKKHVPFEAKRLAMDGPYYYRPAGGESYPDIGLRLHSFLHSLYSHQSGKRILVVTHADVILMIRKMLERLTEAELLKLDATNDVKNCGVTSFIYSPQANYLTLNHYNKTYY